MASAADRLWEAMDYAGAVEAGWFALRDVLRDKLDSTADGAQLVNEIGEKEPKLLLTDFASETDQSMHKGIVSMLRGVALYVRNPIAHGGTGPPGGNDPARCSEYLAIMSLCARHVVDAIQPTTVEEIVREASQTRFAPTREGVRDLVSALPPAQLPALVTALGAAYSGAVGEAASPRAENLLSVYHHALEGLDANAPAIKRCARNCARLLAHDSTFNVGVDLLNLQVFEILSPRYRSNAVQAMLEDANAGRIVADEITVGGRFTDSLLRVYAGLASRDQVLLRRILMAAILGDKEAATAFGLRVLGPLSHQLDDREFDNLPAAFADAVMGCERGDDVYDEAVRCVHGCSPQFAHAAREELRAATGPTALESTVKDAAVVRRVLGLLKWRSDAPT